MIPNLAIQLPLFKMAMGNHQISHLNTGKTVYGFMAMFMAARYAMAAMEIPWIFFPWR